MNQFKEVTLSNLAGGVANEIFQRELAVVAKNIADQNTDPTKPRKITLSITLTPDEKREEIKATVSAKSVVASVKPAQRTIFLGKLNGKATLLGNDPMQGTFEFNDEGVTSISGAKNA